MTFLVGTAGTFTVTATGTPAPTLSETGALPPGVTFIAATGTLSGMPAAGTAGAYPITFTAHNGAGADATQNFTLTVNQAAAITSANNVTFTVATAGTFTVAATGSPAPTLSETGSLPSGVTFTAATGTLSGTPTGTGGTYSITFTAHNGVGADATQNFTLTVNQAPTITSANSTTFTAGASGTFTVTATGTPVPTLSETGTLPAGVTFTAATGILSGTPAVGTAGTYPITFTAHNGVGADVTQSFTLTVNQAPTITSANSTTFTVGASGSFTVTATGTPTPTLSETGTLPSGVTFTAATGTLSGTPAAGTAGTYPMTITAHNGTGTDATQNFILTVNQAPAITSANSTTFTVSAPGTFTVTATGLPAPTLSETGTLPSGVTFTNNGNGTGTLSGTPAGGTLGTYPITFTAHNGVGADATQNFTLTVSQAPAITSANNTTFTVGTAGTFTVTAAGMPTPTLSETGTLPGGVTFTASTGTLSGTPAAGSGGTYPITFTAHNGAGADATQNFTLTVNQAPTITSANSTTFTVGASGTFTMTATGTPVPTLSETGTLPAGVTFTAATGILSGTPAVGTAGTYPITFTAHNGVGADATQNFTLTVNQVPAITSANNTTLTVGTAGTFTVTAAGQPTPTLSETGTLPSGVTFTNNGNGTGTLSGTPAGGTQGTYPVTFTAHNGVGADATQSFTLTVNQPPTLLLTSGNPISGVVNTVYGSGGTGFTLTATGGVKPFNWSWAAKSGSGSQTPPGLSISTPSGTNGLIAGTPNLPGTFQVTVTVTDSTNASVSADYSITITPASSGCTHGPGTLCGQFTFLAQGASGTSEAPVMIAGAFTADGNGHITAGILDFNSASLTQPQVPIILGPPTSYQVGQDGRGTITLSTSTAINGTGTIQFTFALNSTGTFAFLFESDDVSTNGTGNHASGYLQAADSTKFSAASISGGYALGLLGGTSSATRPRSSALAAVSASGADCGLTSNGNGLWINNAGVPSSTPTSFACGGGGLTTIDPSTGRGTVTIVLAGAGPFSTQSLNFSFYVIDATKLIFISSDAAGPNLPILSGTMFKQLKASFITSDLGCGFRVANEACVFGLSGEGSAGSHVGAGRAVGTNLGELTITRDDNNGGVITPARTVLGWTVTISANGLGTIVPPFSSNLSSAEFVLIDTDDAILAVADGSVQVGFIRHQTAFAPSSAPGRFIFGTQLVGNGSVSNASGVVAVARPAPNAPIAGTIDLEQTILTPTEVTGAAVSGTYTMDPSPTGRGTGSSAVPGPSQFIIYNVGPKEIVLLESNSTNKQPMLIDLIQ